MAAMGELDALVDRGAGQEAIRKIAAELHRRGVTADELGRIRRISMWQGLTKNPDGEAELHDLYGFQLSPSWEDGPAWPVLRPGPAIKVAAAGRGVRGKSSDATVVILPDMQCGYFRNAAGALESIHDVKAIDTAVAIVATANPAQVVLLGDNLDGADFGKYRLSPAFAATTQATVDYLTALAARLRAAAPTADIVWLAGNHEERLQNYILDNAKAAFGLRQGMTPTGWPVLSIPHLCRLDDYGVRYLPGYPASEVWITPTLRAIHGDRVRSKGSTAHAYLPDLRTSIVYGHVHRIEQAWATRTDHDGPVTVGAFSPGCLARTDGAVPSYGQGLDLDGRPLTGRSEDWQQGVAVVSIHGDDSWDWEQVRIREGVGWWRGERFEG